MPGKDAIDGGGIAQTALDALHLDRLVADDLQANIVPLLVQTEMLQPKQYAHPAGAADAGDTESFAAQVLGALDVGTDDEVIGVARVKSGEEFEFMSSGDGSEHGAAAGAADMNAPSGQSCDQSRRAPDEYRVDFDAVLGKKALLLGEPERHDPRGVGGVADDVFRRRRCESRKYLEKLRRD